MENELLFKLNIQNFAGDGDEDETGTPTKEVENEDLDETQEETEDEPNFEDGEGNEEDEAETEDKKNEQVDKKSIKEQNKINAERRLQEKHKKELEMERKKAYLDGLKFAVGERNPYTQEKIEDEIDLEMYKTMKEMEEKGLDPVEDYPKYIAQKQREERKAQLEKEQAEIQKQEQISKDIADFDEKYGKGSAEKLLTDENFTKSKLASKLGKLSLEEVYELYTDFQASVNAKAEEKIIQKEAISKSTPGRPGIQNVNEQSFIEGILSDDKKFKEFQAQLMNKY